MSQPYFVRTYRRHVAGHIAALPFDEAMAQSVGGGDFALAGKSELDLLVQFGLRKGHSVIDVGCGAGRLSSQVSLRFGAGVSYVGTDVVPDLLAYARVNAPGYKFFLVDDCVIPAPDAAADFVSMFSVFTHLRRRDILRYLAEASRVLRPGGKLIFSYLEPVLHFKILASTVLATLLGRLEIENHFASTGAIRRWAAYSGLEVVSILPGQIGQSVAVLQKS